MYVCIYIRMYFSCFIFVMKSYIHICVYACICTYDTCTYIHIYVYICMHIYMYMYDTCKYMYTYEFIYIFPISTNSMMTQCTSVQYCVLSNSFCVFLFILCFCPILRHAGISNFVYHSHESTLYCLPPSSP